MTVKRPCTSCGRACRSQSGLCRSCTNGPADNLPKLAAMSLERLAALTKECVEELRKRQALIGSALKRADGEGTP